MTVTYFFRKPRQLYSIERVFATIQAALPSNISIRNVYSSFTRGFAGRLFNIFEASTRQSDINHITGDVHYIALALSRRKTILTVHDCGTLDRLTGWRKEFARLFWFEWPTRCVAAVTVISEATRSDLLRHTSCPEKKITVIPDPLPPDFRCDPKPFSNDCPRLLQVGTLANKNLENVIAALGGLRCHLTVVGSLSESQKSLLRHEDIQYTALAGLSDAQLRSAYEDADIILFCSTREGFGMPIIEANAAGRPVITSDVEPMRSVAGGAACLVDPHNCQSIRSGIERIVGDEEYRRQLVLRGFANAARFEARRIAEEYLALYRTVLAA